LEKEKKKGMVDPKFKENTITVQDTISSELMMPSLKLQSKEPH
jgi:hypothetical protein